MFLLQAIQELQTKEKNSRIPGHLDAILSSTHTVHIWAYVTAIPSHTQTASSLFLFLFFFFYFHLHSSSISSNSKYQNDRSSQEQDFLVQQDSVQGLLLFGHHNANWSEQNPVGSAPLKTSHAIRTENCTRIRTSVRIMRTSVRIISMEFLWVRTGFFHLLSHSYKSHRVRTGILHFVLAFYEVEYEVVRFRIGYRTWFVQFLTGSYTIGIRLATIVLHLYRLLSDFEILPLTARIRINH